MPRTNVKPATDVSKRKKAQLFLQFITDPNYVDLARSRDREELITIRDTLEDYEDWFFNYHPESDEYKKIQRMADMLSEVQRIIRSRDYSDLRVLKSKLDTLRERISG